MSEVSFYDMRHGRMRTLREPLFQMLVSNLSVDNPTLAIRYEGGDDVGNGDLQREREPQFAPCPHGRRRVSGL